MSGEELLMFYGAGGERLAEFTMSIVKFGTPSQWYLRFTEKKTLVWFGSKLLRDGKYSVIQDRLGSVRWRYDTTNGTSSTADYYPYGQEKPSATTNDREKFATYLRDPESGLDYADQRYSNPGWGRFLTPDPYQASAGPGNPGSWNRYAYVEGDPVNKFDPSGLTYIWAGFQNLMAPDGEILWNTGGGGGSYRVWTFYLTDNDAEFSFTASFASPIPQGGEPSAFQGPDELTKARNYLRDALKEAKAALDSNPGCMKLYGDSKSRAEGFNPIDVLEDIVNAELNGTTSAFGNIDFKVGGDGVSVDRHRNISIGTSNWNGWGAAESGAAHNAHTLLHELGHVYDLLPGAHKSRIASPDALPRVWESMPRWLGGGNRSKENDKLVDKECFSGKLGY